MLRCEDPLTLDTLAAYRTGELDPSAEATVEEHYFTCEFCAARLRWVESLSDAVCAGVRAGTISAAVSSAWVTQATTTGINIRTYELAPGGSVACTASPKDDFVVVRLRVERSIGSRADIETTFTDLATGQGEQQVLEDIAVDAESGEVVYAFSGARVRSLPKSRWVMRVRPHGDQALSVGPFTMNHTPWDDSSSSA